MALSRPAAPHARPPIKRGQPRAPPVAPRVGASPHGGAAAPCGLMLRIALGPQGALELRTGRWRAGRSKLRRHRLLCRARRSRARLLSADSTKPLELANL